MLVMELGLTQSKSQLQPLLNGLLPRWCQQWSDHLQHKSEGLPRQTGMAALHPEDSSRRWRALWFSHCRACWQTYCDRGEWLDQTRAFLQEGRTGKEFISLGLTTKNDWKIMCPVGHFHILSHYNVMIFFFLIFCDTHKVCNYKLKGKNRQDCHIKKKYL